jgi:hypothetical protein
MVRSPPDSDAVCSRPVTWPQRTPLASANGESESAFARGHVQVGDGLADKRPRRSGRQHA